MPSEDRSALTQLALGTHHRQPSTQSPLEVLQVVELVANITGKKGVYFFAFTMVMRQMRIYIFPGCHFARVKEL